jgi:hypothetical protein
MQKIPSPKAAKKTPESRFKSKSLKFRMHCQHSGPDGAAEKEASCERARTAGRLTLITWKVTVTVLCDICESVVLLRGEPTEDNM